MFICRAIFLSFLLAANAVAGVQEKSAGTVASDPDQAKRMQQMRQELIRINRELNTYSSERYRIETEYSKKYYAYLGERADENVLQLRWQRSASEKLLWVVVLVVISGVIFSGYQLWRATRSGHAPGESTLELEGQRVRITSSVVGVAVLALSMAFFYFFLIEVYRIKVVDMSAGDVKPFVKQP